MRKLFIHTMAALAALAARHAPAEPRPAGAAAPPVHVERVPHQGLQPQVVMDAGGLLRLVYFAGEPGAGDLWYVTRAAPHGEFSKPLRVNSQRGSAVATGTIRGAQVALGQNDLLHVAWNGSSKAEPKGPGKHDSPMLYARLASAGAGFEPQRNVIRHAYGLDGGGCVAADRNGNVCVVWHAGTSGEAGRRVWMALSEDNGAMFREEVAIDAREQGACGCCGLKAFADSSGAIYVLFRSARDGLNRDMELLCAPRAGLAFEQQRVDRWPVAACPMSAEAFAETPSAIVAAWETQGQIGLALLEKGSTRVSQRVAAPGQRRGRKHPALAVNGLGQVLLAWSEGTGWQRGGEVAWQVFDDSGTPLGTVGHAAGLPAWSFPAVYARSDGSFGLLY